MVARRRPSLGGGAWRVTRLAALVLAVAATPAGAHPLGNFSINHQTRVKISSDRVELLYILDQAEIPTAQERGLSTREVVVRKRAEVDRNLLLIVNGHRRLVHTRGSPRISFPRGAGGLPITRLELPLVARVERPRIVDLRDYTFDGRIGWVDIVAESGHATAVRTAVSQADPTNGLRTYRGIAVKGVPDQRAGRFLVKPGHGTLAAPGPASGTAKPQAPPQRPDSGGDGFANVFEDAASGNGLFVFLLLAAFAWGGIHALSPGHGKAMVAAYLVGTRGTAKHAVALGGIVTVTHTIGVFALGLVTLFLSQFILPEDLYPWLNLAAGLLIVGVGIGVLRSRLRWRRQRLSDQAHDHRRDHAHDHTHRHDHERMPETTWRGLTGMGISAGLIPCPTALVVLLAAITQRQIGLGLLLIVVFSLGLASTLTGLGLAVVYARRLAARFSSRFDMSGRLLATLPAASTFVILVLGIALTAKALPDIV